MKTIRVTKLKQRLLGMNPAQKVWFSDEKPNHMNTLKEFVSSLDVQQVLELSRLVELHKHKLAQDIITPEQREQLNALGFSIRQDWD